VLSQPPLSTPSDWAGPVAGPTVIERHFGIPRSTLFRWQKRDEAIALKTGSSRFVFPLKQFVDARPADGIAAIITVFGEHRLAWQWLVAPNEKFGATSPMDALLSGKVADVLAAAHRALEQNGAPPPTTRPIAIRPTASSRMPTGHGASSTARSTASATSPSAQSPSAARQRDSEDHER
jgi:hypothetical protein